MLNFISGEPDYEVKSWTKCLSRRFVFSFRHFVVSLAVDKFSKIREAAAKKSLQPVTEKKKVVRHRQSQVWFDKDCQNIRKRLRHISNRKQAHPHNEEMRLEYLAVKRQYKSMLRHKK